MSDSGAGLTLNKKLLRILRVEESSEDSVLREDFEVEARLAELVKDGFVRKVDLGIYEVTEKGVKAFGTRDLQRILG